MASTARPRTLIYSDVVSNSAPSGANLDSTDTDILTSFGSVVADPQGGGQNCEGFDPSTASQGYNYESGGTSCGFGAGPGDVSDGPDPQLAALAANGGPTQTRLPTLTSPLLNKIPAAACGGPNADITTDQRGITRPQQGSCDIGAVEVLEAIVLTPRFTG